MSQQRKRRPGEPDPRPDADAPMRFVRESEMARGQGSYGMGGRSLTHGVIALIAWRKRRKLRKLR